MANPNVSTTFKHETYLTAQAEAIKQLPGGGLPEGLQKKIDAFAATKAKIIKEHAGFMRNAPLRKLQPLSEDLFEQIEIELEEAAAPPPPPEKKPDDTPPPPAGKDEPPPVKKKKGGMFGWVLTGILVIAGAAVGIDYYSNKNK